MAAELPIIYVNGELNGSISPLDRGFNYGDGVFETCRIVKGRVPLWEYHKSRLVASLDVLRIAVDMVALEYEVGQALQQVDALSHGVLKIQVTRGAGGRGYRSNPALTPTHVVSIFPADSWQTAQSLQGVRARVCELRLSSHPVLAGVKHMNRLEQVLARQEWVDEFDEGVLLDQNDQVIEGTFSNLFMVKDDSLITPLLTHAGVRGVMRRVICEQIAPQLDIPVHEMPVSLGDLKYADEVFFCNSVIGIWPLAELDGVATYSQRKITKWLQHDLHRLFESVSE